MTVVVPTREEWEADALACGECVDPLAPGHRAKLCWKHNIQWMQIQGTSGVGPKTHIPRVTEPKLRRPEPNNGWERGIARDDRGVRILHPDGRPVRMKEYTENRHAIDAQVKRLRSPSEG